MALPSSGPISLGDVRSELGGSGPISLGDTNVRALAGRSSGSISLSHLRGKSAREVVYTTTASARSWNPKHHQASGRIVTSVSPTRSWEGRGFKVETPSDYYAYTNRSGSNNDRYLEISDMVHTYSGNIPDLRFLSIMLIYADAIERDDQDVQRYIDLTPQGDTVYEQSKIPAPAFVLGANEDTPFVSDHPHWNGVEIDGVDYGKADFCGAIGRTAYKQSYNSAKIWAAWNLPLDAPQALPVGRPFEIIQYSAQ